MPQKIIWCFGIYNQFLEVLSSEFPNIILLPNFPSQEELDKYCDGKTHCLLVLDDMLSSLQTDNKQILNLFTRYARHKALTIFYLNQNTFQVSRTINLQASVHILLHPGRDFQNFRTLGSQIYGAGAGSALIKIWHDVEKFMKYPYIVLTTTPNVEKHLKILTNIFRGQDLISYIINQQ